MAAKVANVSQLAGLATTVASASPSIASLAALVVTAPPFAKAANVAQSNALVVAEGSPDPKIASLAGLVVVRLGLVENLEARAWTFDFDGHSFYVLQLGPVGTFVYDFTSKTWSRWRTANFLLWNMFNGIRWNGINVAADLEFPFIYEIRPDLQSDEGFRPIIRKVSGALTVIGRDFKGCDIVYLTASVGDPTEFPTTVDLRFSDDQGNSWSDEYSIALEEGNTEQQLSWRSLGQMKSPGRIFEITDTGGLVRISALDVMTEDEEDD